MDSFNDNLVSTSYISLLNKENKVELSPHAYNVKKFIFYDVPNAKPISKNEFEKKWMLIEKNFSDWGWVISPVVNAHFHAYSEENFEIFKKKNGC